MRRSADAAWRRAPALLAAAAAVLALGAVAQDADPALRDFARPAAAVARTPPLPRWQWSERLNTPAAFDEHAPREPEAALLAALRAGRVADSLALVKVGADPDARDLQGGRPLVLAARLGADDLVRELLRHGADPDAIGEGGWTALGAAAWEGRRSIVRLLLRAGADPARWGAGGQGALHLAALAGRIDVLDELLRSGAAVESLNRQRETALDVAANAGQSESLARLLAAGADATRAGQR